MKAHLNEKNYDELLLKNALAEYDNIDEIIKKQQEENNVKFFCYKGCSDCCDEYFYISESEYLAIRQYVAAHGVSNHQAAVEQRQKLKDSYPNEFDKLLSPVVQADSFDDNKVPKGFAPCIFLKDGACSIYPVRPILCRLYGVSRSYALCKYIFKRCRGFLRSKAGFQKRLESHTVNVPYGKKWIEGIDFIVDNGNTVLMRQLPLFWWFSSEK
ncbi:MAG: YkgJ family cysteine cluster protein [Hydrogenoanaerobacterium sp.]